MESLTVQHSSATVSWVQRKTGPTFLLDVTGGSARLSATRPTAENREPEQSKKRAKDTRGRKKSARLSPQYLKVHWLDLLTPPTAQLFFY